MLFDLLFKDQTAFLTIILAIVYALTVHEFAHAAAASVLGDQTAKFSGRLSLNPLVHLDIFGTLMLLLAGFGWGKPVPVNPYNLKWRKWGESVVSLAGPIINFLSVILFILIFKAFVVILPANNLLLQFLVSLIIVNLTLGVFNLIPIPPLDGSKVLLALIPDRFQDFKTKFSVNGMWILLILLILDNVFGFNIFGGIFNWFINLINFLL